MDWEEKWASSTSARINCNNPGSTSPPGAAAYSTPHSFVIAASVLGPE